MTTLDRIKRFHPGISDQHAKDAAMVVDAIQEAVGWKCRLVGKRRHGSDSVCAYWSHIDIYVYRDLAAMYYNVYGLNSRIHGKPTPEWAKVFAEIARLVKEDGR